MANTSARRSSPLFVLVAIITVIAALYVAEEILLPLALAILLSFLLTPLANRLEDSGLPRLISVIGVVAMFCALLGGLGWVVTRQLFDLSIQLPAQKDKLISKIRSVKPSSEVLEKMTTTLKEVGKEISAPDDKKNADPAPPTTPGESSGAEGHQTARDLAPPPSTRGRPPFAWLPLLRSDTKPKTDDAIEVKVVEMPPSPLDQVRGWLGPLLAPIAAIGMVILMVLFMLLDRENQRNRLIRLFGRSNLHLTTEAFGDIADRVGRYLRMQFLINAGYGSAVGVGLWLIGVPSAVLWGVLGFSLRFLPYIGPWIAAVLPILLSIATSDGWTQPLLVIGWYVLLELVTNNVAEPLLYGSSIGISSVGVILAAVFWTWVWGPIGLVIAMPLTVCLVVSARYVPELHFITVLLTDQSPLTPSERVYQRLLAFDNNEPMRVAETHLKSSSLASFYDEVLIPALVLAEQDRTAGLLNGEQEEYLEEAVAELIAELGEFAQKTSEGSAASERAQTETARAADYPSADLRITDVHVLCIPLRDDADAAASQMLAQLLAVEGFQVDVGAPGALTGEIVDHVAKSDSDLVVISILPPIRPRDSRLLWKRLRSRYPTLPIIVGYWMNDKSFQPLAPPEHDTATKVTFTLESTVALVRSTAAQLQLAKQAPSHETRTAAG